MHKVVSFPMPVCAQIQNSCSTSPTQNISDYLHNFVSMAASVWLNSLDAVAGWDCNSLALSALRRLPTSAGNYAISMKPFLVAISKSVLLLIETLQTAVYPAAWESEETPAVCKVSLTMFFWPTSRLFSLKSFPLQLCPVAPEQPTASLTFLSPSKSATCKTQALFCALSCSFLASVCSFHHHAGPVARPWTQWLMLHPVRVCVSARTFMCVYRMLHDFRA